MIRRLSRTRSSRSVGGFFHVQSPQGKSISGFGDTSYVRLKDEDGNLWRGSAEILDDRSVHYRFRNGQGKVISGLSDGYGILLRDERGKVWRGYVY